ncbi:MAG TPA: alpha/beta hydrolase [Burkholderiales bacterium]|nr:alpha/beta hydrolase [Burkholderiales bacterium]
MLAYRFRRGLHTNGKLVQDSLMHHWIGCQIISLFLFLAPAFAAEPAVTDIATRPGVTQRFLLLRPAQQPVASVVLFAGGHGGLDISPGGGFGWGAGNFLVRSRELFAQQGFTVAVVDKPSDRRDLTGFRQTREHVADVKALIAWLRKETGVPVWLVGTSFGTYSAAYVASQLAPSDGGPDGIVLTSTTLTHDKIRAVPDLPVQRIAVPALVVHHRQDGCPYCRFADVPRLMGGLTAAPAKELIAIDGGVSKGDPCEAFSYHGYNGKEQETVASIADWIKANTRPR